MEWYDYRPSPKLLDAQTLGWDVPHYLFSKVTPPALAGGTVIRFPLATALRPV